MRLCLHFFQMCDLDPNYVFYRDRNEWADVVPLEHNEDENAVVKINYTEKFKDVYDYFRAVLVSGEKSERVIELTKDAVLLNPANYTAWQYRKEVLFSLKKDLRDELVFTEKIMFLFPKNYQIWHYRRQLIEYLNNPSLELELIERILVEDPKNYHAWQYRQWIIKQYKLFDKELEYTQLLIEDDIRNNSAWNQRFFVIKYTTGFVEEVILREFHFTCQKIEVVTENESAWNYMRGILYVSDTSIIKRECVKAFVEQLYETGCRSPFLLNFIIEMCEEHLNSQIYNDDKYNLERAKKLCYDLANELDTIRSKFWIYMADTLAKKFQQ